MGGIGAGTIGMGGDLAERRVENVMLNQELREQNQANFDRATGNFLGAARRQANANALDRARNSMQMREIQCADRRAMTDFAFGDIGGYMREEQRAMNTEIRREN